MICPQCIDAIRMPVENRFRSHCISCEARALALVGDREALMSDPLQDGQREVLERIFGSAWRENVAEVRRWIGVIRRFEASNATP